MAYKGCVFKVNAYDRPHFWKNLPLTQLLSCLQSKQIAICSELIHHSKLDVCSISWEHVFLVWLHRSSHKFFSLPVLDLLRSGQDVLRVSLRQIFSLFGVGHPYTTSSLGSG